ncbi:GMC oxidoreductase [Terrimonas alba]|uniref:GMC oxidoreductase n=1 Tax=Terrimonas alba TaxID=3349636 RepID=UPI0035F28C28
MHIDARDLEDESLIEGDICIVGAGPAGITMALEWINSPYKVILLEGGGFEYDERVQNLYDGKITGHPYYPMKSSRLHYFGGASGHWGGMCSTFDDIDFKKRDWIDHSGWPINLAEIDPYYKRAHPVLDLGPYEYDLAFWQQKYKSFVPLPLDENIIWSKMWQFSPPTRFGEKYRSTIVNAPNVHLYTYANVTIIQANGSVSSITEVVVKNYSGKQHTVKAKYFILACCAIQNARLLLASNQQVPAGLGNGYDLVGRYFMEHPELKTGELWLAEPNPLKLYIRGELRVRAELAVSAKMQEAIRLLNGTVSLMPISISKKLQPAVKTWQDKDPRKSLHSFNEDYGKAYKKNIYQYFSSGNTHCYGLYTRIEQSPNPSSRVVLSAEKDELGMPRANLHWAMTSLDKWTIRKLNELIGQQVGAAGIGRVRLAEFLLDNNDNSMPSFTSGGWHHMGTTRMHNDPKQGVVDSNCKIHGIDNLFAAGSSCFPTGGAVNPTLTLVALSLRLSDHLKERIKENIIT